MKPVLEAFTPSNKSIEMKSSEKSPTSRLAAKRNNSNYRRNTINKYRKGNSLFASGKRQKTIGDFISNRADKKQHVTKSSKKSVKSTKNCLHERSHHKNTSSLDETSSSSFTYSSNSQRFIDVDIAGHCSRLDIDGRLEIVELVDNRSFNKSENEESEKENSPRLKRNQSGGRPSAQPDALEGREIKKLNQAAVKELEYYEESLRDDFSRPEGYYRYLEGDCDERQEKVEYDLDDEDMSWLHIINSSKCEIAGKVTEDSLEMAIDRLEKVSAHLQLNSIKNGSAEPKDKKEEICDDDIFCSICLDDECQNTNVILLCDFCNLAVHQECYGIPYVPEGQWLCSWCSYKKETMEGDSILTKKVTPVGDKNSANKKSTKGGQCSSESDGECCLCPVKGGALKKTNDGRWAHVLCALWIPEVGFENIEYLEPITKLEEVPPARHKLTCSVCKKKDAGACIQCMKRNCYVAFHIMCAQKMGTYMKIEQGTGEHEDSPSNIKKSFYCDIHKPEGAKPFTPMYDDESSDCENIDKSEQVTDGESPQKQKGRNARSGSRMVKKGMEKKGKDTLSRCKSSKSLSAKSTGSSSRPTKTITELPVIPSETLLDIEVECFGLSQGGAFIGPVYNYWILKRNSRNNMPLLKAFYTTLMSNNITEKLGGADDAMAALEGLKDAKKLRNEMEKVRLLLELVRKREKVKLLMIKAHEQEVLMKLHPWNSHLLRLLNILQALDKCDIFAQPVSLEQVPGYDQEIDEPMDFSTMRQKILDFAYNDIEDFEKDFNLMINNCLKFNSKHTLYYKAAVKLRKQASPILKEAHAKLFDMSCDPMHLADATELDLDATEIMPSSKHDKEVVLPEEPSKSEIKQNIEVGVDSDKNSQERLEDTIGHGEGNDTMDTTNIEAPSILETGHDNKQKIDNKNTEDRDEKILIRPNSEVVKQMGGPDEVVENDVTLEISNIETTRLYNHEEISMSSVKDRHQSVPHENDNLEDDMNDHIIEDISINEGALRASLHSWSSDKSMPIQDSGKEKEGKLQELRHQTPPGADSSVPKVIKKQEILKFLSALTRLIQSSSEEVLESNITITPVPTCASDAGNDIVPQTSTDGIAISVSKEFVETMNNNSRPKSTRKTSSVYRRQQPHLNELSVGASSPKTKPKTPLRFKFDPPKNNSTPLSDVKRTFGKTKTPANETKSTRKPSIKKLYGQLEAQMNKPQNIELIPSVMSPRKMFPDSLHMSPSDVTLTNENRRTSERTKTATHRYLIDDDNIMAALMSPSKSRKRKNSSQDGLTDDSSKNKVEDEPPVLSRCPSPIEEEEVRSTEPSSNIDLSLHPDFKGLTSLVNPILTGGCEDDYDDDDDFKGASLVTYKFKKMPTSGLKSHIITNVTFDHKNCQHDAVEPAKKRLKLDLEMAPPHLIKSSFTPAMHKTSKNLYRKAPRSMKGPKRISLSKNRSAKSKNKLKLSTNGIDKQFLSPAKNNIFVQGAMPELVKNASKELLDSSDLAETIEMPRLDDSVLHQNISLAASEMVSFTSTCEEDVLVAEECYADVEDPGIILDKPPSGAGNVSHGLNSSVFLGVFKTFSIISDNSTPSKKRLKDLDGSKDQDVVRANKKSKKESGTESLETSRLQKSPTNFEPNALSAVVKETSAEELTAANALLDFRRSFCHGETVLNPTSVDSRRKNIFDEFKKLSTMPTLSIPTTPNIKIDSRPSFTPTASMASLPPSDLLELKDSPLNTDKPSGTLTSTLDKAPLSQMLTASSSSQVQFFSWSEKSLPDNVEADQQFSGNPDIDSAYSTSSSSSSSLISSSPMEEHCDGVL